MSLHSMGFVAAGYFRRPVKISSNALDELFGWFQNRKSIPTHMGNNSGRIGLISKVRRQFKWDSASDLSLYGGVEDRSMPGDSWHTHAFLMVDRMCLADSIRPVEVGEIFALGATSELIYGYSRSGDTKRDLLIGELGLVHGFADSAIQRRCGEWGAYLRTSFSIPKIWAVFESNIIRGDTFFVGGDSLENYISRRSLGKIIETYHGCLLWSVPHESVEAVTHELGFKGCVVSPKYYE